MPSILPFAEPWMSDANIAPGSVWFSEIQREIKETQYAIACITPSNVGSPWVTWESGALYGQLVDRSRVVPLLFDMSKDAISGPMGMFQLIEGTDGLEMKRLLRDVNSLALEQHRVSDRDIDDNFDTAWPDFRQEIADIIRKHQVYAFTWPEQIDVLKRICGDPQKVMLFMVNTGATIEQVRNLRWGHEKQGPDGSVSFFVIQDKPPEVLVLNSIARRIIGYMREGHHMLTCSNDVFVFGHPDSLLWRNDLVEGDADYTETVEGIFQISCKMTTVPIDGPALVGLESLRASFEHRLVQVGVRSEDIKTLLGCNPSMSEVYQYRTQHLVDCVEKIVSRDDELDWIPR